MGFGTDGRQAGSNRNPKKRKTGSPKTLQAEEPQDDGGNHKQQKTPEPDKIALRPPQVKEAPCGYGRKKGKKACPSPDDGTSAGFSGFFPHEFIVATPPSNSNVFDGFKDAIM
jgi:hypothetical protein